MSVDDREVWKKYLSRVGEGEALLPPFAAIKELIEDCEQREQAIFRMVQRNNELRQRFQTERDE